MKYAYAFDLQQIAEDISKKMFSHIQIDKIKCFRSYGSSTRGTIARCHTIGKLMQLAIGVDPHYALEFISERFDKMNKEEQVKVIVHELMHIPNAFGGGFRHHDHVTLRNVDKVYKEYKRIKDNEKENYFKI